MATIVLVGGNGYIGREITRQWLKRDPEAQLYVTSRSDRREIEDERVHHVQVDVNDEAAFEGALPETVDYLVNLAYGSMDAMKTMRAFAEGHGVQVIGNVGIDGAAVGEGFADFADMKARELEALREGAVPVVNYDLTVAYGADRDDDLLKAIRAGALDALPPVHVEVVARLLIDRLTKAWLA